jgi:hypothetical protein
MEFRIEPGTDQVASDCPNCASYLEAYFFPPFFRAAPVGVAATALVDHTEASCFYHTHKQAVGVCDGCGRLVCALCSIELGSEHLCPNCLSSGKKKGKLTTLENVRTRYDSIALSLAIFAGFLGFFSCGILTALMAPAAIYISIRHWNSPGSLLGSSKVRFVIAILVSVLTLLLAIGFMALFIDRVERHPHR